MQIFQGRMKKIMFNDKYGLTQAVLDSQKTMTRRVAKVLNHPDIVEISDFGIDDRNKVYLTIWFKDGHTQDVFLPLQIGEKVAIAQSYYQVEMDKVAKYDNSIYKWCKANGKDVLDEAYRIDELKQLAGYDNKMFVKAELMPHHIEIDNIGFQRLQDISDEDILKEGVFIDEDGDIHGNKYAIDVHTKHTNRWWFPNARLAYATLIDWISGKGTWDANPWVFAYSFELVD